MKISRTKPFDFTEVEPDYPQQWIAWCNAKEKHSLELKASGSFLEPRSVSSIKKFWKEARSEKRQKVVITKDLKYGNQVLAKAGSTCWAYYYHKPSISIMINKNWSASETKKRLAEARSPQWMVRVIGNGPSQRPIYKGERQDWNFLLKPSEVKVIK